MISRGAAAATRAFDAVEQQWEEEAEDRRGVSDVLLEVLRHPSAREVCEVLSFLWCRQAAKDGRQDGMEAPLLYAILREVSEAARARAQGGSMIDLLDAQLQDQAKVAGHSMSEANSRRTGWPEPEDGCLPGVVEDRVDACGSKDPTKDSPGISPLSQVHARPFREERMKPVLPRPVSSQVVPTDGRVEESPARRIHLTFEGTSTILSKLVVGFVTLTLFVSVVAFVLESMPEFRLRSNKCHELRSSGMPLTVTDCKPYPMDVFFSIESFCIIVFTIDYVVRVATAHAPSPFEGPICFSEGLFRTLKYAMQPINVVDLLSLLPYYVQLSLDEDESLGQLEVLRLARICRVFKFTRHHPGVEMLFVVLRKSGQPFFILLFFNVIISLLFATLMFIAEGQRFSVDPEFTEQTSSSNGACVNETLPAPFPTGVFVRKARYPLTGDQPTPIRSIPAALYWVSVTLTTVGYGEIAPTTFAGKAIAVATFYTGILFLALPISILGQNFEEVYRAYAPKSSWSMHSFGQESAHLQSLFQGCGTPWLPPPPALGKKIFFLLDSPASSRLSRAYSVLMMLTILAVTTAFVLESLPSLNVTPAECGAGPLTVDACRPKPMAAFHVIETLGVGLFTIDYFLRVLTVHTATLEECGIQAHRTPGGRVQAVRSHSPQTAFEMLRTTWLYCIQWMNLIDLLAILPFYLQLLMGLQGSAGLTVVRTLRLSRIFRVLRMRNLSSGVSMFASVIIDSLRALSLLFFMTLITSVFLAACIHFAEGSTYSVDSEWLKDYPLGLYVRPTVDGHGTEPSPFTSVLYSFWWFFVTATTVGYGDDFPTTTLGRLVGVVCVYCGLILFALPISVIGSDFASKYPVWVHGLKGDADSQDDGPTLNISKSRPDLGRLNSAS